MRTPDAWSRKGAVSTMLLPVSSLYGLGTALRVGRAPRYTFRPSRRSASATSPPAAQARRRSSCRWRS